MMLVRFAILVFLLMAGANVHAEEPPDDAVALRGVMTGKVVWDINTGNASKLALYLGVIQETHADLKRQGIQPDMVLAFRGESLKILSVEQVADKGVSQAWDLMDALMQHPGVRMEACAIAARIFGVDLASIRHGVRPVGNTFVSLIGYQARGYAIIPIY